MAELEDIDNNLIDLAIPVTNSGSLADAPKRTRLNALLKKLRNNILSINTAQPDQQALEAAAKAVSIGWGQTWFEYSLAERTSGTTYTNDTERPIMVSADCDEATSIALSVDGQRVGGAVNGNVKAIVPVGSTYSVTVYSGVMGKFRELRSTK